MNNSLPRLIDGMIATLRREIIPHVEGDFARGQAFGLIYMLNSVRLRASWSNAFLLEQISALQEAGRELEGAVADLPDAPAPVIRAPAGLPTATELETMRELVDVERRSVGDEQELCAVPCEVGANHGNEAVTGRSWQAGSPCWRTSTSPTRRPGTTAWSPCRSSLRNWTRRR